MESIARLFLCFLMYSCLGWVCECIYCWALDHKFTNRGFLSGPLCPVYGFGALLVLAVLGRLRGHIVLIFLGGFVLTSVLEYLTSLLLEKVFHMAWWDYSDYKFNLNGRVCLRNSTLFGLLAVAAVELIAPTVTAAASAPSPTAAAWLAFAAWCVLEADLILSVHSVLALSGKLQALAQLKQEIRAKSTEAASLLRTKLSAQSQKYTDAELRLRAEIDLLTARLSAMESSVRFPVRRLMDAFPRLRSLRETDAIRRIRDAMSARRRVK